MPEDKNNEDPSDHTMKDRRGEKGFPFSSSASSSSSPSSPSVSATDDETGSDDSSSVLAMSIIETSGDECRDDQNAESQLPAAGASAGGIVSSDVTSVLPVDQDDENGRSRREPPPNDGGIEVDFDLHLDEAKEEVHVLLANVDRRHGHRDSTRHDEDLRNGTVQHLARCLHRLILCKGSETSVAPSPAWPRATSTPRTRLGRTDPKTCRIAYRSSLEPSRAIQVTALCRALHLIVTRCTVPTLQAHLSTEDETMLLPSLLTKDLLSSLPIVIHLLATSSSDLSNASFSLEGGQYDDDACFVRQSTSTASCLVRLSGLSSAVGIAERIAPLVHALPTSPCSGSTQLRLSLLGQVLFSLLGLTDQPSPLPSQPRGRRLHRTPSHLPSDLRVDAATALTSLLPPPSLVVNQAKTSPSPMLEFSNGTWLLDGYVNSAIIALLSAGAAVGTLETDEMSRRCIGGLRRLALWNSGMLSGKLLSQRRVVTALCDHLMLVAEPNRPQTEPSTRCVAEEHAILCIELSKALLTRGDLSDGDAPSLAPRECSNRRHKSRQSTVQDNIQLLVGAVIRRLLQETREGIKLALLDVLVSLVEKGWLRYTSESDRAKPPPSVHTNTSILNVMFLFASSASGSEDFVVSAASRYLQAVRVHEVAPVLSTAVDLLSSPFPKVREQTFQALLDLCFWKTEEAKVLVGQSSLLDRLGHAIKHGTDADCAKSVSISKHLVVFSHAVQSDFCGNEKYVSSIVALATAEPIKDRIVYGDAVDVLLELMSVPNQLHRFAVHDEKLLPWLVKFANRTSDEELKRRAAGIIVRYSTVLLKGFETHNQ